MLRHTKYKTDVGVFVMALQDMQAACLIDLTSDEEIGLAPNKEFIAPEVQASEVEFSRAGARGGKLLQ